MSKKNATDPQESGVAVPETPIKKRRTRKPDLMGMISSLNADAIRTRLAEIASEQAALTALLTVAEARDKKEPVAEKPV